MLKKTLLVGLTSLGLFAATVGRADVATAQRVVDVSPEPQSSEIKPEAAISGSFETQGTAAVNPNSVQVFVNGQNVTRQSTITSRFFSYRPNQPFSPGPIQVRVEYANVNGLRQAATWNFTVQRPQVIAQIDSITHNAVSPLTQGDNFLATIEGTPGAKAKVLLIRANQSWQEIPAQEVSAGVYVASMTVGRNENLETGAVVGQLTRQDQQVFAAATQPAAFAATTANSNDRGVTMTQITDSQPVTAAAPTPVPLKPEFTNYEDGGAVTSEGFRLEGRTRPRAKVEVVVTAPAASLGGIVNIGTQTLLNRQVTANAEGQFEVEVPEPTLVSEGAQYVIKATAIEGSERSTTEMTLRQR